MTRPRAINFLNSFPPAPCPVPSVPSPNPFTFSSSRNATRVRAIDMANSFPPASQGTKPPEPRQSEPRQSITEPRPIAKLPRRAQMSSTPVDVDLTMAEDNPTISSSDFIELTDSDDEEMKSHPPPSARPPPPDSRQYVFNTNDLLSTRQPIRDWKGTHQPAAWVLSRDEFHADQVNRDRALPADLDDFPSYAISAGDLQSLHRYLMSRYEAETFEEYVHLLALFRNTRAIEMEKARARYEELAGISASVEIACLSVLRQLQQRHSPS